MNNVYTTNDLMTAAADALRNRDLDALNLLRETAEGWLQTDEERGAQLAMLDAMEETLDELDALSD